VTHAIVVRDKSIQLLEVYHNIIVSGCSCDDLVQASQTINGIITELTEDTGCDHSNF
jgi:hypothetical protein